MNRLYKTLLFSILCISGIKLQAQIYVSPSATGLNDGSSWNDAYNDFQNALNNATVGDEIWIASGTYYPTEDVNGSIPSDPRDATFNWTAKDLKIYGGFDGTETNLSERDWVNNQTIFSGDIGTQGDNSDNCKTVLTASNLGNTSSIDGVSIVDAKADGSTQGGFLLSNNDGLSFYNCILANNEGPGSGGSWISNSDIFFKNCSFHDNHANEAGSAYLSYSDVVFEHCIFHDNSSNAHGGNVTFNGQGSAHSSIDSSIIVNCLFYNNTAGNLSGGALYFYNVPNGAKVVNCTFANNSVSSGGDGVSIGSNGVTLNIFNSIFWNTPSTTQYEISEINNNSTLIEINHAIVHNGVNTIQGNNVINQDPLFNDVGNDDYSLMDNSPAIDMGDTLGLNMFMTAQDLAGNPRMAGDIDLGCYENQISLSSQINEIEFSVYPNPNEGRFMVTTNLNMALLRVIDLSGKTVITKSIFNQESIEIDVKKGVYIIEISDNKTSSFKKLVIK